MTPPRAIDSILKAVGRTPLVRLAPLEREGGPRLFAKCEYLGPGNAIFDRAAAAQVSEAILGGHLPDGGTLVSSGGTDAVVSLAMAASATGHRFIAVVPRSMLFERKRLLVDYGARVVTVPDEAGPQGAHERAMELAREASGLCVCLHAGRAVVGAYEAIGRELIEALGRAPSLTVCGLDAGAVPTGIVRGLEGGALVAAAPASPNHLMLGLTGQADARFLDASLVSDFEAVEDEQAWAAADELASRCGLLAGLASGAVLTAMLRRAQAFGADDALVAVLPDSGERRFMLSPFFN